MSKKLTPWLDGDVRPAKVGVYRRKYHSGRKHYSLWNGARWNVGCTTVKQAAEVGCGSSFQRLPWCGLAQDPNAKE